MQGFPSLSTVKQFFEPGTLLNDMHPASSIVDAHNKAAGFAKRLIGYMFENIRFQVDVEDFVYVY